MSKRSNVIWIFADQLRRQALGCYGDPNVNTPNIDRLASEGILCEKAYANVPLCCPFRASLLTGRHPWETGVIGHAYRMREDIRTVADSFNDEGYQTAYIGKWHLDGQPSENRPVNGRKGGFNSFKGFEVNNKFFDTKVFDKNGSQLKLRDGYQTDILTDLCLAKLENTVSENDPFFMVFSVEPPHAPYVAPENYMDARKERKIVHRENVPESKHAYIEKSIQGYYAQIENLDFNIGRIISCLEQLKALDDTIIMFFSDHGNMLGAHGLSNKELPYEESVGIPLIVRYPKKITPGSRFKQLITNLDFYPTMLGLTGIKEELSVSGKDLSHCLINPEYSSKRKRVTLHYPVSTWTGYENYCQFPWRAYITEDFKITFKQNELWEMYDLRQDPYELNNIIGDPLYNEQKEELIKEFIEELCRSGDGFQVPVEYRKSEFKI